MLGNGCIIGPRAPTTISSSVGIWTPDQASTKIAQGFPDLLDAWPLSPDPNFSSVVGLWHMWEDGPATANGRPTMVNSVAGNSAMEIRGTQPNGMLKRYGTWPGPYAFWITSNTGAQAASNANYAMGTGDFTIEGFFELDSTGALQVLIDLRSVIGAQIAPEIYINTDNSIRYFVNNIDRITSAANIYSTNTRYHFAVARSGTSTKLFLAGNQVGSTYSDSNNYNITCPVSVGCTVSITASLAHGIMGDIRITKGVARYTSNFTPPTGPFPDY